MFNNKKDDDNDFCELYKSEILGSIPEEKGNSVFSTILKLLTIFILLAIIVGVSFYGYNYFINSQKLDRITLPPVSMQVSDEELPVEVEEIVIEKEVNSSIPLIIIPQMEEIDDEDIEKIANDVKIAIAKSEILEENQSKIKEKISESIKQIEELNSSKEEESLEVPTSAPEAKYLEDLADLSKEIDKERKK